MTTVPEGWPAGVGLHHHAEIDSTNEEAKRLAASGVTGPCWIIADAQTAGRGRRGNQWVSKTGNLYATLLFTPGCSLPVAASLSFVTALSVYDAVETVAPALTRAGQLKLKWPNDLLLEDAKLTGILIETAPGPEGHVADAPNLAVGIGVNLAHHPEDTPYPATDLAAHNAPVTPLDMATAIAAHFETRFAQWNRGAGFDATRADWLVRARGVGGPITVRLHNETIEGEFVSLDADGALELRTGDTLRKISAGEVFFPDTASRASA